MVEIDDSALLQEYALRNSQEAFAALVRRHLNLVYSVALRHLNDPEQAQDVAQAVFTILAQKAARLHKDALLQGWLYQTARLTSLRVSRNDRLRRQREQEAQMERSTDSAQEPAWQDLAPVLDEAISRLGERDRNAIILRFFEGRTVAEAAAVLGSSEAALQKRVSRAIEKMRTFFARRGVKVAGAALVTAISANSLQAAPVGLAKSIGLTASLKGAAASHSTLTLIKGTLKLMAWTKAKAAVTAVALLLATGTATVVVKTSVFDDPSTEARLEKAPQIATQGINRAHGLPKKIFTYPQGDERTRAYLEKLTKMFFKSEHPAIKSDRELTEADTREATLYIYGSPENHSFLEQVRDQLPIRFEADGIVVGNKKCKGRDVGAIFTCPNPLNPQQQLLIYGAVSPEALADMNSVFHGPTDYVVFNNITRHFNQPGRQNGAESIEQYLLLGSFDKTDQAHWRVDERLQLQPRKALHRATASVVVPYALR